jgi:hypothetical protein
VEGSDGNVYAAGTDRTMRIFCQAVVYRYDGFTVSEEFRAPYDNSRFYDIESAAGTLWVTGWKLDNNEFEPCLFRMDGEEWTEVAVPASVNTYVFEAVFPVSSDFCWLANDEVVYTYDNGEWTEVLPRGLKGKDFELAVTGNGRAFAFEAGPGRAEDTVYVSDDRGASWTAEPLDLQTEMYYAYGSLCYTAAAGEGLFITMPLISGLSEETEGPQYLGVIVRDEAPPGKGKYETSYVGDLGWLVIPDTWGMAFRDPSDGYVVGYELSLALESGQWYPEDLPDPGALHFRDVVAGRDGFWGLADWRPDNFHVAGTYLYHAD